MNATAMVERLLGEDGKLSMVAAGALLGEGQGGAPIHPATVTRWCLKGVKVAGGRRLQLEHIRAGGKLITTRAAIVRFLAAQTSTPDGTAVPRTPAERRRSTDAAVAELEKLGV
ncbi:DUF1580 domain-containing protein [Frigoriglobus tundricola]|uniref:DUF1580 domain-containing protein n=1 Tax=Frigoriglobus tundricola TaxID=2774151 RepID=A0A6M5YHA3_9BACT|nr:DUF1580 domain-containing protein [Frigoriglobus tundricola]QJW92934.1 hypothetical protein FTUN_0432 [Frigoriglobus tundricola]